VTPNDPNPGRLAGEVALVTGSTAGLGTAIARRLASEGAAVVVTGRDPDRGEDVAAAVGGTFLAADLNEESACVELVEGTVAAHGSLTVLVNNAVTEVATATVADVTTEAWEAAFRVNVTAPMWLCRAAIPHLRAAGHGSIVNVSSRAAERASPGLAAYVASKGALNALTRSLAVELAADGIRANTVAPGYVLNERRDADLADDRRARLEGMHLLPLATADEVAAAVAFLAGPDAAQITGTLLPVDGGSSTAARATSFG
jgi:NAD(P)-dependent dehydrogenase (short-subunit alcohol dehydrogenase family)